MVPLVRTFASMWCHWCVPVLVCGCVVLPCGKEEGGGEGRREGGVFTIEIAEEDRLLLWESGLYLW